MRFGYLIWVLILFGACVQQPPENQDNATPAVETAAPSPTAIYRDIETHPIDTAKLALEPAPIVLKSGDSFFLEKPAGYELIPVVEGLKRIRFFARSPDDRYFLTDMYNLSDNRKGKVYLLGGFDTRSMTFDTLITYMQGLRNPNNLTFYRDTAGRDWLYLALTDKLVRYPYTAGETRPHPQETVIATFPDYGLSYKYGGWHLTRTVAAHNHKIYVAVGSSCNVCEEKEDVRATILEMDPDGSNSRIYVKGLRNAVDIRWVEGKLYATNMGADHLGADKPADGLYEIRDGKHYGWPYCYEYRQTIYNDSIKTWQHKTIDCDSVPLAYSAFEAHGSPLGLEYFPDDFRAPELRNYFLAALHGSGKVKLAKGYAIVRTKKGHAPETFIGGFLQNGDRVGRPCGIMRHDDHSFFFTDDHKGVIYYVRRKGH